MRTRGISRARKGIVLLLALVAAHIVVFAAQGAGGRQPNGTDYHIYTRGELIAFGDSIRGGLSGVTRVVLKSDIVFNEVTAVPTDGTKPNWPNKWTPINLSNIHFTGEGHTISGLFVDSQSSAGLFASLLGNSVVSDLGIVNAYVGGNQYVGAIAGSVAGTSQLRNCFVKGTVVKGTALVGGLVGGCQWSGQVGCSYAAAKVIGTHAGGVVGTVATTAKVQDCFWQKEGTYGTWNGVGLLAGSFLCEGMPISAMADSLMWRLNQLKAATDRAWGVREGYPFLKDANRISCAELLAYVRKQVPNFVLYTDGTGVLPNSIVVGTEDTGPLLKSDYEITYSDIGENSAEFHITTKSRASAYLEQPGAVVLPFTTVDLSDDEVLRSDLSVPYDGKRKAVQDFANQALILPESFGQVSVVVVGGRDSVKEVGNYTDPVTVYGPCWSKDFTLHYAIGKVQLSAKEFECTLPSAPVVFDGSPKGVHVRFKSGLVGAGSFEVKYNGSVAEPVTVGKYVVSVDCTEGSNYAAGQVVLDSFYIVRADLSPDFKEHLEYNFPADGIHLFNGEPYVVTVSFKSSVAGGFENVQPAVTYNGSPEAPSMPGEYTVAAIIPETENHSVAMIELGTFSIVPGIPDASLLQGFLPTDGGKVVYAYDGTPRGAFSLRSDLPEGLGIGEMTSMFVNKVSGDTLLAPPSAVGQYRVVAFFEAGENFRSAYVDGGEFEIEKALVREDMFIIQQSTIVPYDGEPHFVNVTLKEGYTGVGNVVAKYIFGEAQTIAPIENGRYDVLISVEDGANYKGQINLKAVTLEIVAVESNSLKKWLYYDLTAREYTGGGQGVTVKWAEGVDTSKLGAVSRVLYGGVSAVPVNVGEYKVSVQIAAGIVHDAMEMELGTLSIVKASLETPDKFLEYTKSVAYDGTSKEVIVKLKNGLTGLGGITVEYGGGLVPKEIGNYEVKVSIATGDNFLNTEFTYTFSITKMAGILSISQPDVTYTGIQIDRPFVESSSVTDQNKIRFEYKVSTADDYTYTDERPVDAGWYIVRATVPAEGDYAEAVVLDTFAVRQAQGILEISQDDILFGSGQEPDPQVVYTTNVDASITFRYKEGGPNDPGEYKSTKPTAMGRYTVSAVVQATKNYTLANSEITFVIKGVAQPITYVPLASTYPLSVGKVQINASSSGHTLTYSSNNPAVADVGAKTGLVTLFSAGSATIIIEQDDNYLYEPAAPISLTFNVKDITGIADVIGTVGRVRLSSSSLVSNATVYLEADLDDSLLQGAEVVVYDLTGKMIERKRVESRVTALHTPTRSGIYLYTFINARRGFRQTIKAVVR
jgi:hypothetical protein